MFSFCLFPLFFFSIWAIISFFPSFKTIPKHYSVKQKIQYFGPSNFLTIQTNRKESSHLLFFFLVSRTAIIETNLFREAIIGCSFETTVIHQKRFELQTWNQIIVAISIISIASYQGEQSLFIFVSHRALSRPLSLNFSLSLSLSLTHTHRHTHTHIYIFSPLNKYTQPILYKR